MERKTAWNEYKKKDMKKLEKLNAGYRAFLDNGKTERECVKESVRQAEEAGYVNLDTYVKENRALKPGDKVYAVCMSHRTVPDRNKTADRRYEHPRRTHRFPASRCKTEPAV